ncbi:MAG: hypothetical protein ABI354_02455 [Candidatus Saccharimonadales bacterium]
MLNGDDIVSPVQYQSSWLIIGVIIISTVALWYFGVWMLTRKKKPHTIHTLKKNNKPVVDIAALKIKYLGLIDTIEQQYASGALDDRSAHQSLSMTVRLFVYEAKGVHAQRLTLSDIKKTGIDSLITLISLYYPAEFAYTDNYATAEGIKMAREMVTKWQ